MLRIGICDDEGRARDALRLELEKVLHNEEQKIIYEFSSGEGLVNWLNKHPAEMELLFLDVEMKGISGMDAARKIRESNDALMIVFVTGYADFVFDGYAVAAMDYVIKPVKEDKLLQIIKRAAAKLKEREPQTYTLKNADGLYRIPISEILYFYSEKRLIHLVTGNCQYSFYGKLDEVEAQLNRQQEINCLGNNHFVRIHQRYLVNGDAVQKVEQNRVIIEDQVLPISRGLKQEAVMALAKAMLGE